jgi:uncharacterized membrane protein YhaH (DUF805 family)
MEKASSIYEYKAPKSSNQETSFFTIKGRISIKVFLLRFALVVAIYYVASALFYEIIYGQYYTMKVSGKINEEFLTNYGFYKVLYETVLPLFLIAFILVQAAKRIHDTNNSAWKVFWPGYNLILLFRKGSPGANDYGLSPYKEKVVTYYEDLPAADEELPKPKTKPSAQKAEQEVIVKQNTGWSVYSYLFLIAIVISLGLIYNEWSSDHDVSPALVDSMAIGVYTPQIKWEKKGKKGTQNKSSIDDAELLENVDSVTPSYTSEELDKILKELTEATPDSSEKNNQ